MGLSRIAEAMASAPPRSPPVFSTRTPPVTLTYTSWSCNASPALLLSTAHSMLTLPVSTPLATRRGLASGLGATRLSISTSIGRVPSRRQTVTTPGGTSSSLFERKNAEGSSTSTIPRPVISKTPTSLVDPKRFLRARKTLKLWNRSPSNWSTVSTMCSSTRGPAMDPSFVTCPTRTTAMPSLLASRISLAAHSRTCPTPPRAPESRDDSTPQNPVQLPHPGVHPAPALDDGHLAEDHSPTRDPGLLPRRPLRESDDLLALAHLLHKGAPLPTIRAPPEPLGRLMAAVRTDVKRFRSHDPIVLDRRKSTANNGD